MPRRSLFAPLTGIEVQSTRVEGTVLVVGVGLSVNLASLTIDQVSSSGALCFCVCCPTVHYATLPLDSTPSPRYSTHFILYMLRALYLALAQVLSKRRKVVVDMCEQIRAR